MLMPTQTPSMHKHPANSWLHCLPKERLPSLPSCKTSMSWVKDVALLTVPGDTFPPQPVVYSWNPTAFAPCFWCAALSTTGWLTIQNQPGRSKEPSHSTHEQTDQSIFHAPPRCHLSIALAVRKAEPAKHEKGAKLERINQIHHLISRILGWTPLNLWHFKQCGHSGH